METTRPRYVSNAIRTPDGTILRSRDRHDYQTYVDANGKTYMVDGGLEYLRRNVNEDAPHEELSIESSAPFGQVREALEWGTYGKDGKDPLRFVKLSEMSNDHIENVLDLLKMPPKAKKPMAPSMEMRNDFREAVGLPTDRPEEPIERPRPQWLIDFFEKELEYREQNDILIRDPLLPLPTVK